MINILETAETALTFQQSDGSFLPGHNGPWMNQDTPLRVTAHWSILFARAYQINGDDSFKVASEKAIDYILSSVFAQSGFAFHCRNDGPDKCNGLIGQAWILEALFIVGKELENKYYVESAEKRLSKFKFNNLLGLWYTLETDGTNKGIHSTINQQIYFNFVTLLIAKETKNLLLQKNCKLFLKKLKRNYRLDKTGIIIHRRKLSRDFFSNPSSEIIERSIGYQSFILFAFAIYNHYYPGELNQNYPKLIKSIFKSFVSLLDLLGSYNYSSNRYLYSYNQTGIEILKFQQEFDLFNSYLVSSHEQYNLSMKLHYNSISKQLDNNVLDLNTSQSRIYELSYINDIEKYH